MSELKVGDRAQCGKKAGVITGLEASTVEIRYDGETDSLRVSSAVVFPEGYWDNKPVAPPTIDDLYDKIAGFPEALQEANLPMLSKASVLAQLESARQLERIADAAGCIASALEKANKILQLRTGMGI